jgi:nitroreductase
MGSMIAAIEERGSVRAYLERPVEAETKHEIRGFLEAHRRGPFGGRVRLELLDFDELERAEVRSLGTYGFITGARLYIVSAIADTREARHELGYCLQKVVLHATQLGLGTCWIGGTFRRSQFGSRIGLSADEIVPVVSPIGFPRPKRNLRDRLIRRGAASDQRRPWENIFFDGDLETPFERGAAGQLEIPLESVRLGPSASNKQPWRLCLSPDRRVVHFFLRRTPGYEARFKGINLQDIDMGIAMCHFELAAHEFGLDGSWQRRPPEIPAGAADYIVSWQYA